MTATQLSRTKVRSFTFALATLLLAAIITALWIRQTSSSSFNSAATTARATPTSASVLVAERIVVADFENLTGDPALDSLGRIAAKRTVEALVRIGFDAVASQSITDPRDRSNVEPPDAPIEHDPVTEMARIANAGLVVTGDFDLDGSNLRVHADLIDASTIKVLYSIDHGESPRAEPNAAIETAGLNVRDAVAHVLRQRSEPFPPQEVIPPRYEAVAELLLGREGRSRGNVTEQCARARRAIELDPSFVTAYRSMADCYITQGRYAEGQPYLDTAYTLRHRLSPAGQADLQAYMSITSGQHERAVIFQREAIRLAPENPWLKHQLTRYLVQANRPGEALRLFDSTDWSVVVDPEMPNYGMFHYLILTSSLSALGMHERELVEARRAGETFPDCGRCWAMEARALASLRRNDELDAFIERAMSRKQQDSGSPGYVMAEAARSLHAAGDRDGSLSYWVRASHWYASRPPSEQEADSRRYAQAVAALWAGRLEDAQLLTQAALETNHPLRLASVVGQLGLIAVLQGNRDEAHTISRRLAAMREPALLGHETYQRARIAAMLGEKETALELLRTALHDGYFVWNVPVGLDIRRDPAFENLTGWPAFEEMIEPKG